MDSLLLARCWSGTAEPEKGSAYNPAPTEPEKGSAHNPAPTEPECTLSPDPPLSNIANDPDGRRRILFVNKNRDRKSIWLGKVSKRLADEIKTKVESLNTAAIMGCSIDGDTAEWVGKIGDELHAKLALAGLVTPRQPPKPVVQALLGEFLESYIAGRTDVAPRTRINLDAAGIPYAVEGPDGPLYADFHALRHTYLTLLGRGGVDLRTAQELAGHSTPTLTARYTHRRLYDLAGAVEKLPSFLPAVEPAAQTLRATGTEGPSAASKVTAIGRRPYTPLTLAPDGDRGFMRTADETASVGGKTRTVRNPLHSQGVADGPGVKRGQRTFPSTGKGKGKRQKGRESISVDLIAVVRD